MSNQEPETGRYAMDGRMCDAEHVRRIFRCGQVALHDFPFRFLRRQLGVDRNIVMGVKP